MKKIHRFLDAGYITYTEGAARKRTYRRPTAIVRLDYMDPGDYTRSGDVLSLSFGPEGEVTRIETETDIYVKVN